MKQIIYEIGDVEKLIADGKALLVAGDENLLKQLPAGNWIGGSSPYFMGEEVCLFSREKVCVTQLPDYVTGTSIRLYDEHSLANVYTDASESGFSFIIIPGQCDTLLSFALNAPNYKGFATHPLIGWISGAGTDDAGKVAPCIVNGSTGEVLEDGALVMHVGLPENKAPEIGLLNIFEQGDGDVITFPQDGFRVTEAFVNGKLVNFSDYLIKNKTDTRLPLVADYYGEMINISFQEIDRTGRFVILHAPVFRNVEYRHARPVDDYVEQFVSRIPESSSGEILFSCNCILNYLYSGLEGRKTHGFAGPITFGEIAYQLLNQTMTYITISDI